MLKVGRIEHRQAEEIQARVAVAQKSLLLVMGYLIGFQVPERFAFIAIGTMAARSKASLPKQRPVSFGPHGAGGRYAVAFAQERPDLADESLIKVGCNLRPVGEYNVAIIINQSDIALCNDHVPLDLVDYFIGAQYLLAIGDLDISTGGNGPGFFIVQYRIRAQQCLTFIALCLHGLRHGLTCKLRYSAQVQNKR